MSELTSLSDRVMQLEELLSHHEHRFQQLNEVVVNLIAEHDRAKGQFQARIDRLATMVERSGDPFDPDEKPPHY